jgi:serine/threonine-protein kinase
MRSRILRLLLSDAFVALGLTAAMVAGSLLEAAPLERLEGPVYDQLLQLRKPHAAPKVTVVAVDEASLSALGDWPWPRAYWAGAVRRLSAAGVRAVGLCVPLGGPEANPGLEEIERLRRFLAGDAGGHGGENVRLEALLEQSRERLDGDGALARALEESGVAVLPLRAGSDPPGAGSSEILDAHSFPAERAVPEWETLFSGLRNPLRFRWPRRGGPDHWSLPPPALVGGAAALGYDEVVPDADGVVRTHALLTPHRGRHVPSLVLRLAAGPRTGAGGFSVPSPGRGAPGVAFGERFLPTDDRFRVLVDYSAEPARYSFVDLWKQRIPAAALRGATVLVGPTAPRVAAAHPTPLGESLAPVEVAAHGVATLLGAGAVSRPPWGWALEALLLLQVGLLLAFVAPRLGLRTGGVALGATVLAWAGVSVVLFLTQGLWLKAAAPAALGVVGLGLQQLSRLGRGAGAETAELNRELGLALQGQGMLDLAFERLRRCPPGDNAAREALYNLALDFERKRMPGKASAAYRRLLEGGRFRDAKERLGRLRDLEATVVLGGGATRRDATLVLDAPSRPTLGRYEVVRELGQGAMGTVYLGRDPKINRDVAIKTLLFDQVDDRELPEVKKRFVREAEAAGRLSHPGIVTVYDVGEEHDLAWLAMELLDGRDLTEHCAKGALLPPGRVVEVVLAVAEALAYAHGHGVVHRDIKPANIMVAKDGRVKVTDFGIARVAASSRTRTQTGVLLGTPNYMSPEQVAGKRLDGRSDLFSLGVVFYELLSGRKPFQAESLTALMYSIAKASYLPLAEAAPKAPRCCRPIVERLLARSPSRRYRDAGALVEELKGCAAKLR